MKYEHNTVKFKKIVCSSDSKISNIFVGTEGTPNFKVYYYLCDRLISPLENIKLHGDDEDVYHAVVEVPIGTNIKYESAKDIIFNPITPNLVNGQVRRIPILMPASYGFLPQTILSETYNYKEYANGVSIYGDGDPVDVLILGNKERAVGEIVQVKIIGSIVFRQNNHYDIKVLALPLDLEEYKHIHTIEQAVEIHSNQFQNIHHYFENYKKFENPIDILINMYGSKKNMDSNFTKKVIELSHKLFMQNNYYE